MASAAAGQIRNATNVLLELKGLGEQPGCAPLKVTLLELVEAVGSETDDDREVVAAVVSMLTGGRVKLQGNFREEPPDSFDD